MKKVAIVGGGISGLATAYYLRQKNPDIEITIFESESRCGGLLETVLLDDAVMECGPDAFISEKPWALELCQELQMDSDIISTRKENRRSFILSNKKLKSIPKGFYLTAPKNFSAWWNLPAMSFFGKIRMLGDLFLPARKDDEDESVASFVTRRFGKETLEKLAQPMIAGIYTSCPENLSLLATFPKFRSLERKYGSIIRGLIATQDAKEASGPRYSLFLSLRGGMGSLIDKLSDALDDVILKSTPVTEIEKTYDGWQVLTPWSGYDVDAVCLAVPSHASSKILRANHFQLSDQLGEIKYEPVATLNFLFSRKDVGHALHGFGFVVPASEKSSIMGCSFSHEKFDGRALKSDQVLLRAFIGGAYGRSVFQKSDDELESVVFNELKEILSISSKPLTSLLKRYPLGMPQYEVGHWNRVHAIFNEAKKTPGLFLTGLSYFGIGIPDCIKAAKESAEHIDKYLSAQSVYEDQS